METFVKLMQLIQDDTIDFKARLETANKVISYCENGGGESDPYIEKAYKDLLKVKNNGR
jgi:hypothetical protein